MKQTSYRNLLLHYDYTTYAWIISTKTGELIGSFTDIDKAKSFIDNLLEKKFK